MLNSIGVIQEDNVTAEYNEIGKKYNLGRHTDPYILNQIQTKLYGASSVLNIGAGTGSYEPAHLKVIAAEPSKTMIKQRPLSAAPVVQARAEDLPFKDKSFSFSMTVLSMHHWGDWEKAISEIKRVTRKRFVAVTWDPDSKPFWLTRDYFPEIHEMDKKTFPSLSGFYNSFKRVEVTNLEIPADCADGFLGAYWRRPEAYLDERIRANMSTFFKISGLTKGLDQLKSHIETGAWSSINKDILKSDSLDAGYRIVSAEI